MGGEEDEMEDKNSKDRRKGKLEGLDRVEYGKIKIDDQWWKWDKGEGILRNEKGNRRRGISGKEMGKGEEEGR